MAVQSDVAQVLNCSVMDILEGRVPYKVFMRAAAYSNAKAKAMPFIDEDSRDKAMREIERKKQLEEAKRHSTMAEKAEASGPLAKLVALPKKE